MLPNSAIAAIIAWNALTTASMQRSAADSASDSTRTPVAVPRPPLLGPSVTPVALTPVRPAETVNSERIGAMLPLVGAASDTVPRARRKSFAVSDAYQTRLTIHRRLSWAMLPLFAASYFSGDELLKKGSSAPQWARSLHRPTATGAAVLFTANTVTGTWNLWESRHNPNGRTRRILHSVMFTAASAGFVYAGTKLADEAEQSQSKRQQHTNVALASMGVSTLSWLVMLIGN